MRTNRNLDLGAIVARVTSFSARRATLVVAVATLLSIAGVVLALMLDPGTDSSAAGDGGGEAAAATEELRGRFGGDPIVVLVRGRLTGMLLTEDVARMLSLEGCISGNVPRDAKPAAPVCSDLARRKPVQVVYGPGTFINEAAGQILDRINFDRAGEAAAADRAAREARRAARGRGLSDAQQEQFAQEARRIVTATYAQRALELAVRFGLSSVPALNNPEFVLQLVFEPSLGAEVPKPRFAYLFPHTDAAVIQARLRPGLSAEERRDAVEMVRQAVAAKPFDLKFGSYVVSGSPVVAEGVAAGLSDSAPGLVAAAILLVALALVLTFRAWPVMLPLALGAGATAITLGGLSLLGGSFSVGVAAAMPLLCALGAGWALQLQGRFDAAPELAAGTLASALAFAMLLISPVSMARSFGALVAIGLIVSFVLALTAGAAVVGARATLARQIAPIRRRAVPIGARIAQMGRRVARAAQRVGARLRPRRRRARPQRTERAPGRRGGRLRTRVSAIPRAVAGIVRATVGGVARLPALLPALAVRIARGAWRDAHDRPARVLSVAFVLSALGWLAATQIDVTSDPGRLLPTDRVEARDLASIERETGTPGDVNVIVRSERLLDPAVVRWMSSYQRRVLRQNGFRAGRPCREADLCPALSLTNLFGSGRQSARQIREAVAALPPYFSQNVITADRRTANIAFRMGAMPPQERREVVESLSAELDPPAGVEADLAGAVVTASAGEDDLATSMWLVTLLALVAVALAAAVLSRSLEAALVVAIPLSAAAGWVFLVLFLLPVDVDFLTAALGAIVVAICAGHAVPAARGYRDARAAGLAAEVAVEQLRERRARAVAFGAVTVGGFLALTVCDIPALRDLGLAGAVSLPLCGLGMAVSLPATLVWADRRGGLRVPRTRAELRGAGRSFARSVGAAFRTTAGAVRQAAAAIRRGVPEAGRKARALVAWRR
jgi:predicted RND superfamily exporter protein